MKPISNSCRRSDWSAKSPFSPFLPITRYCHVGWSQRKAGCIFFTCCRFPWAGRPAHWLLEAKRAALSMWGSHFLYGSLCFLKDRIAAFLFFLSARPLSFCALAIEDCWVFRENFQLYSTHWPNPLSRAKFSWLKSYFCVYNAKQSNKWAAKSNYKHFYLFAVQIVTSFGYNFQIAIDSAVKLLFLLSDKIRNKFRLRISDELNFELNKGKATAEGNASLRTIKDS